ncbi:PF10974 domain protein [Leptospira noguchii str. Cascata]|nr:PF10974 domain protein [Leptospira noguchii str. Cascata]
MIFDFSQKDPTKPWKIYDEDGFVNLTFIPEGERKDKMNLIVSKLYFRHLLGNFRVNFALQKKTFLLETFTVLQSFIVPFGRLN